MQRRNADVPAARILVVEDSRTQAEELRLILEGEGYAVEVAYDAEAGLEKVARGRFDLVLSDILLPQMSGYELCRALKGDPGGRRVPVILLTSLNDPRALIQTLECGADGFLTKPYEPRYLIGRVEGALANRAGGDLLGERVAAAGDRQQLLGVLASAYEEAVRSQRQLEAKHGELLRIQQQKDELVAFIVHDLKNPLNDVVMRLQMLQRRPLGDSERRSVRMARSACDAMNRMVLNLLDVGRAEEGRLRVSGQELDLAAAVEEVVEAMRSRAELESSEIAARVPAGLTVRADRALLVRVLENLVDNSLKYGPEGGRVEVVAAEVDGGVEIRVCDEGPGVPDALKEKIFDKYARVADDDLQSRTSRGLGLTFARLAVEAHGGRIHVEDREPRGSAFVVRLPGGRRSG